MKMEEARLAPRGKAELKSAPPLFNWNMAVGCAKPRHKAVEGDYDSGICRLGPKGGISPGRFERFLGFPGFFLGWSFFEIFFYFQSLVGIQPLLFSFRRGADEMMVFSVCRWLGWAIFVCVCSFRLQGSGCEWTGRWDLLISLGIEPDLTGDSELYFGGCRKILAG